MSERLTREEVPVEETWRIEDLFPTIKHWEAALIAVDSEIDRATRYRGRLGEGASTLLE
ncbi:MAG: oligoendopeptidase F family protein, partial [Firmicutes bacterium]|nr:oligoendopeptidase F family protein [Bacillota bacterium]